mgnify:CR=1 FL=1
MTKVLSAVAWPYANGPRHLGHVAGFGVPSDVYSRWVIGHHGGDDGGLLGRGGGWAHAPEATGPAHRQPLASRAARRRSAAMGSAEVAALAAASAAAQTTDLVAYQGTNAIRLTVNAQ